MLSITTKSPYALSALVELHRLQASGPVPIAELARRREIPVQFLEQLFASLRRAGILRSQRGVKGGYTLARPAAEVTVLELVEVLDGPLGAGDGGMFAQAAEAASRCCRRRPSRRSPSRSSAPPARRCTTSNPKARKAGMEQFGLDGGLLEKPARGHRRMIRSRSVSGAARSPVCAAALCIAKRHPTAPWCGAVRNPTNQIQDLAAGPFDPSNVLR